MEEKQRRGSKLLSSLGAPDFWLLEPVDRRGWRNGLWAHDLALQLRGLLTTGGAPSFTTSASLVNALKIGLFA